MKRREFINSAAMLGLTPYLSGVTGLISSNAFGAKNVITTKNKKSVVVIFQRGAVDGLSMLSPFGDSYFSKEIFLSLYSIAAIY